MTDQKNTLLAIALSALVLIGWQYFVGVPQMEKQRQVQQQQQQLQQQQQAQNPAATPTPEQGAGGASAPPAAQAPAIERALTREAAIAASPRVTIETPKLHGSISLKGAQIDDLAL